MGTWQHKDSWHHLMDSSSYLSYQLPNSLQCFIWSSWLQSLRTTILQNLGSRLSIQTHPGPNHFASHQGSSSIRLLLGSLISSVLFNSGVNALQGYIKWSSSSIMSFTIQSSLLGSQIWNHVGVIHPSFRHTFFSSRKNNTKYLLHMTYLFFCCAD